MFHIGVLDRKDRENAALNFLSIGRLMSNPGSRSGDELFDHSARSHLSSRVTSQFFEPME
jgi:hypothetical protein